MTFNSTQRLMQACLLVLLFATAPFLAHSTTYTAVVSGNWSNALTWGGNAPGSNITGEDQIVIAAGVTVNMDVDVEINHQLAVMTLFGTLQSTQHDLTLTAGTIAGTGQIIVEELTVGAMGTIVTTGNITCGIFETMSNSLSLQNSLHVESMLKLMAGEMALENTAQLTLDAGATIQIEDGSLIVGNGNLQLMGEYNLLYTGGSTTTGDEILAGTVANLTVNLSGETDALTLGGNLTVTDSLNLMQGQLTLDGNGLTLNGSVETQSGASLTGDANANLTLNGTGGVTLVFSPNGAELDTCTVSQAGGSVMLNSDLTIQGMLDLEQGELVLNGNGLTVNGSVETQSGASLTGDANANLTLNGTGGVTLVFSPNGAELDTCTVSQAGGSVTLNSDLTIHGMLDLEEGNLVLGANDVTLMAGADIEGGSEISFVLTNGEGSLSVFLEAGGDAVTFPCGTEDGFFPAIISQNEGAADTHIEVSVAAGVFAEGESGTDLTLTESLVNHTWFVGQADANAAVDLDFQFFWSAAAEVNGFDHGNCFISHFVNGEWDAYATAQANAEANGYFSISRENITSLSPFRVADETSVGTSNPVLADFKVFPNPASEALLMQLPEGHAASTARIFDGKGSHVKTQSLTAGTMTQRLDLSGLQPGLYFLKMEGMRTKRFTVSNR